MTAKIVIASAERLMLTRQCLTEQEEDGGDQRAGVTDTDPPDEVRDVPGPADGVGVTPHTDAGRDQVRRC